MLTTFGERLRTLRSQTGLSQTALAGEGMSASYISLLEADKRVPSPHVIEQLAATLGCRVSELTGEPASERDERIDLEVAYARLAIEHGHSSDARRRLELLSRQVGILPRRERDEVQALLAFACDREGDPESAIRILGPLFERSAQSLDGTSLEGPTHLLVTTLGIQVTRIWMEAGDLGQAIDIGHRALAAAAAQQLSGTTDYYRLAATVMGAYILRGDFLTALTFANHHLASALQSGEAAGQAALLWNAAMIHERQGDLARSLGMAERALALMSELENGRDYARIRLAVAFLLLAADPPEVVRADDLLQSCAADIQDLGTPADHAYWHAYKAQVLLHQGDPVQAEAHARHAVQLATPGAAPVDIAWALVVLSDALEAQDRPSTDQLLQALDLLATVVPSRWHAGDVRAVAVRLAGRQHPVAFRAYELALDCAGVRHRGSPLLGRMQFSDHQHYRAPVAKV